MNKDLKNFLKSHKDFEEMPNGKIKCSLTGHEMKADIEILK
jgi:hypothetical protein